MSEKVISIVPVMEITQASNIVEPIVNDDRPGTKINLLRVENARPASSATSNFALDGNITPRNVSVVALSNHVSTTAPVIVNYEKLLARFINCVAINNIGKNNLTEDHMILIKDFLLNPDSRKLVIYIDDQRHPDPAVLQVVTSLPRQVYSQMAYFIKESMVKNEILTESNFERKVQFGKLTKNTMESLLTIMTHVYVPIFLGNNKWPETVRKEFNSQLHKFMVILNLK